MVEGWVVRITFGWSFFAVVRNDDKTLIWLLCCLFSTITRAYILRCRKVWKAQHFCLKFSNRFGIWQAARHQCYQVACQLSKQLEVFAQNWTQLFNGEKFVGNSSVAKRTTQCARMVCSFHLWVAFGDRVNVVGQHWSLCKSQMYFLPHAQHIRINKHCQAAIHVGTSAIYEKSRIDLHNTRKFEVKVLWFSDWYISQSLWRNCEIIIEMHFLNHLNHTTQLYSKLFRTWLTLISLHIFAAWFTKLTYKTICRLHIFAFTFCVDLVLTK